MLCSEVTVVILDTEYGRNEQSGFSASVIKDFGGRG